MVFSSIFFMFIFLPITLALYYIVPNRRVRNGVLLLASLIFYAWGEPVYIILMVFSTICNYILGLDIDTQRRKKDAGSLKRSLLFAVIFNLFILGFFKYYGFVLDSIGAVIRMQIPHKELPLPIGISFYTFQTLSYLIDLYRGKVKVQRNYFHFALYVTMFPQLIAGPIVRYADIAYQLEHRKETFRGFSEGIERFIIGLGKKVLLANNIGMVWSAVAEGGTDRLSVVTAWLAIAAYTFQIYFDFSGYSDMAIGLGKMFGFTFQENFNHPYIATSITDFWRRWHISLSSWFREYVYIPLGGNRVATILLHVRNIFVVWMLTGLWHGASWNFVFWGVYYAIFLILEKYVWGRFLEIAPGVVRHIYTMVVVMIGWAFFANPRLSDGLSLIGAMFGRGGAGFIDGTALYYLRTNWILYVIVIIASLPLGEMAKHAIEARYGEGVTVGDFWKAIGYAAVYFLVIAFLVTETYNPFLYFRF